MRYIALILLIAVAGVACTNNSSPPSNLLEEEAYLELLVELQLIKSYQKSNRTDSLAVDSLRRTVFDKYNTSAKQFSQSHEYYRDNIREQRNRIGKAIEKLRKDRLSEQDTLASPDSIQYKSD